eukprot:6711718-Pyramimonas_sp.AAC.1
MRDFYTIRHNAVGRTLLHAMRQGKLGRWLTLTSFGRVDDHGSNKRYQTGCSHQQLKQRCGGSAAQWRWRGRQQAEENPPLRGRDQ